MKPFEMKKRSISKYVRNYETLTMWDFKKYHILPKFSLQLQRRRKIKKIRI